MELPVLNELNCNGRVAFYWSREPSEISEHRYSENTHVSNALLPYLSLDIEQWMAHCTCIIRVAPHR